MSITFTLPWSAANWHYLDESATDAVSSEVLDTESDTQGQASSLALTIKILRVRLASTLASTIILTQLLTLNLHQYPYNPISLLP